jgi:hypothetical protein
MPEPKDYLKNDKPSSKIPVSNKDAIAVIQKFGIRQKVQLVGKQFLRRKLVGKKL